MGPAEPKRSSAAEIVARIAAAAAALEFRTFVVGFTRDDRYSRPEHEARYRALKVEAGESLLRLWPGRDVDFLAPDVRFDVRIDLSVSMMVAPLFVAGRYRKLSREIPASRWIHHRCMGHGCPECGHTGTLCGPSVQELLAGPLLAAAKGEGTLFHALGREDTDVRMLGRGRPFVLEVSHPRRRLLDLAGLQVEVARSAAGLADVLGLALVDRSAARSVKSAAAEKTYRAIVETRGPLPPDAASRAAELAGREVRQKSPSRVADRRGSETIRSKRVIESRWLGPFESGYLWEARAESGTYIKELISGDGGRTTPSLAEFLGMECRCRALDVLDVHWDPPWERGSLGG